MTSNVVESVQALLWLSAASPKHKTEFAFIDLKSGRQFGLGAVAGAAMAQTTASLRGCSTLAALVTVFLIGCAFAKDDARPAPGCTGKRDC